MTCINKQILQGPSPKKVIHPVKNSRPNECYGTFIEHIDFVKAHELLYNMLDIKTFNAVLSLISKEHEIRIYEANFKEAYADDLFIKHVNKVFESATNAYVQYMYEWSYEIHSVDYIRHNYDGTNSTVKLNFFEIIYYFL